MAAIGLPYVSTTTGSRCVRVQSITSRVFFCNSVEVTVLDIATSSFCKLWKLCKLYNYYITETLIRSVPNNRQDSRICNAEALLNLVVVALQLFAGAVHAGLHGQGCE